jgi:hypothetical protein
VGGSLVGCGGVGSAGELSDGSGTDGTRGADAVKRGEGGAELVLSGRRSGLADAVAQFRLFPSRTTTSLLPTTSHNAAESTHEGAASSQSRVVVLGVGERFRRMRVVALDEVDTLQREEGDVEDKDEDFGCGGTGVARVRKRSQERGRKGRTHWRRKQQQDRRPLFRRKALQHRSSGRRK